MLGRSSVHQQQHAGPAPPKTASEKSKETRKIGPKQKRSSASHHRMALGDCGVFSFMHSLQEVVNSRGALQCVGWSVTLFMYVCGSVSKKKRYLCFCFFLILPRPHNLHFFFRPHHCCVRLSLLCLSFFAFCLGWPACFFAPCHPHVRRTNIFIIDL